MLGLDQVCAFCPSQKDGLCLHAPGWEDEIRAMDQAAMELLGVGLQERISWEEVGGRLIQSFSQWQNRFCSGCLWREACQKNESYVEEEHACAPSLD